ncbi:MAG TPA: hypothetical protein PKK18_00205 [Chitinophagales bacterium]|nr:hypothetical protein [Chitinophagales bacterium]HMX59304.1 hypothetical protein [Chitinophagales bacterium]HNF50434.1 hypothetical protein [Chitinophagales bacterium]HNN24826.1 hypothetical protein [Chitinophagales bacterium]
MSIEIFHFVRFLHVVCASAWFGEVVVINFVLIPALSRYQGVYKKDFLNTIFPKIFNLASVLAGTTAVTGGILLYHFIGVDIVSLTSKGTWGWSILIAGTLGLVLTIFHFFIENNLAKKVGVGDPNLSQDSVEDVHLKLKFIPRACLVVITTIFLLMLNATHALISF